MKNVRKYSLCKVYCLKNEFHKIISKKDGLKDRCKTCMNRHVKDNFENRRKIGNFFRLIRNTRVRIHHALKGKSKSMSTKNWLGIDVET